MMKFRGCKILLDKVSQLPRTSLRLSAEPKSRYQFMRLCGRLWDKMAEEGLTTTLFTLKLHDDNAEPKGR